MFLHFSCYNVVMNGVEQQLNAQKALYREIFLKSADEIQKRLDEVKPEGFEGELLTKYSEGSDGHDWQKKSLALLNGEISQEVYRKIQEILAYREMFNCSGCATCCKLACSEFSPEELKEKAQNGDNFAKQFTSIFIPYESCEEAEAVYPEYIELLKEKVDGEVYFYHCPKVTEDNRCSDYENRPQICRDFPDNPLAVLPVKCGFRAWKDETNPIALMLHSMVEIIDFYKKKLQEVI